MGSCDSDFCLCSVNIVGGAGFDFSKKIQSWFWRPKLSVAFNFPDPDCVKTYFQITGPDHLSRAMADCYYFGFRVKNYGDEAARDVEVSAVELLKKQSDGSYKRLPNFPRMNLLWSNIKIPFLPVLSPSMEKHCDIGHITDPDKINVIPSEQNAIVNTQANNAFFNVELWIKPSIRTNFLPPGNYRLNVIIGASNCTPIKRTFEIEFTGNWFPTESQMFGDQGIRIKLL